MVNTLVDMALVRVENGLCVRVSNVPRHLSLDLVSLAHRDCWEKSRLTVAWGLGDLSM